MTKKTKAKIMTFRQRLRADAEERLASMESTVVILAAESVKAVSSISPLDVMRLACGSQTKSLRYRLVTELANEQVAELEAIYNRQMNLLKDDSDGE